MSAALALGIISGSPQPASGQPAPPPEVLRWPQATTLPERSPPPAFVTPVGPAVPVAATAPAPDAVLPPPILIPQQVSSPYFAPAAQPTIPPHWPANQPSMPAVPTEPPRPVYAAVPAPGASPLAAGTSTPASTPNAGPGSAGPSEDVPLDARWHYGPRFESADKSFSIFFGGRAQFDVVEYAAPRTLRAAIPGTNPLEDGVSFRRLRLDAGGTIYKTIDYLVQVDFVNGFVADPAVPRTTNITVPTEVWVTFRELTVVGNVRVGNQKQPYSFEHLMSSRFLNFLERSLGFDAFVEGFNNGFQPGVTAFDTYLDKRGTWAAGLFKTTRNPFGWNVGRNEAEVNGRVTYLPVYEDDGRTLLHVGVGAAQRDLDDAQARYRSRLDIRNSPSAFASLAADTGLFFGSRQQLLVPELAAVFGPLSFQSEYYAGWVTDAATAANGRPFVPQGMAFFQSWYAEVHYFLTGEHREYNRDAGVFGRVVPRSRFSWDRCGFSGWGAWQATARYSYLDLNSQGITGGVVHDMTLGLNWFLNPNMKMQFNYFLADRDAAGTAGDGVIHGFGTRMAIDF